MQIVTGLFCVQDVTAETFYPPYTAANVGEAIRIFGDLLGDPKTPMSRHPRDYRLWRCGIFNGATGEVGTLQGGPSVIEEGKKLYPVEGE